MKYNLAVCSFLGLHHILPKIYSPPLVLKGNGVSKHPLIIGHRACRGLYPENSLPACLHALELGLDGIELDVVCNSYGEVIVSHEPWFNHEIALNPLGKTISKAKEREYTLFDMSHQDICSFDVGSKPHPKFKHQENIKTYKPLLKEVFAAVKTWCAQHGRSVPFFNIEIKREPEWDNKLVPPLDEYLAHVLHVLSMLGKSDLIRIMSFDKEVLNHLHERGCEHKLIMLSENRKGIQRDIDELGFKPWAYAPTFKKVKAELLAWAKEQDIRVIPWTVNEEDDIRALLKMEINAMISDFPDKVKEIRAAL